MFTLNGRCDSVYGVGKYTRADATGSSVIGYVQCTTKMHEPITEFQIGNKMRIINRLYSSQNEIPCCEHSRINEELDSCLQI